MPQQKSHAESLRKEREHQMKEDMESRAQMYWEHEYLRRREESNRCAYAQSSY